MKNFPHLFVGFLSLSASTIAIDFPPCYVCFNGRPSIITNPNAKINLTSPFLPEETTCEGARIIAEERLLIPQLWCGTIFDNPEFRLTCGCCVTTEKQLREAIDSSPSSSNSPRQIAICADEIPVTSAISLNNKAFNLYCTLGPNYCKLNAQGKNRLFIGAPALANFTKIDFINAEAGSAEKGGALFLAGEGTVNFVDTRFINNHANRGGAMYVDSAKVSVTIQKSWFQKNQATVQAGAIYLNNGNLTMIDSTFKENQAFSNGGVLYMMDGNLTVKNSLFKNNTALKSGGALFFDSVKNIAISDSNFTNNNSNKAALLAGGGGAISSFLGKISLKNIVFKDNSGTNGFDIWVEDDTNPRDVGSFISCETNVIFCNGRQGYKEFENPGYYRNGNCRWNGIPGELGVGPCV